MISVMNMNGKVKTSSTETSSYMNNMMLPEMVRATRTHPLGPDCIISRNEISDQISLRSVNYYWYISHGKGCVECVVKMSSGGTNVTTSDPKCVVTRKHRRFEAYCCMICRSNFVTVVQALLHLKAIHRSNSKILIQDLDIFHNIEKAMEVPPVPLPWHIARKYVDQDKTLDQADMNKNENELVSNNYVVPPGAIPTLVSDVDQPSHRNTCSPVPSQDSPKSPENNNKDLLKGDSPNTVMSIISAITKEFDKPISALSFSDDCAQVSIKFADGSSIVALTPDLTSSTENEIPVTDVDSTSPLIFTSLRSNSEDGTETFTLHANNKSLARQGFSEAIIKRAQEKDPKPSSNSELKEAQALKSSLNLSNENLSIDGKGRVGNKPLKSVRFMLGAPDSSDDERPSTPDKNGRLHQILESKVVRHETLSTTSLKPTQFDTASLSPVKEESVESTVATFDGLRNVVDDLITTASKGRIIPLPPTSPITTSPQSNSSLPLVGSSPQLSNLMSLTSKETNTSTLTRVQSWSPSLGGASFSVASMRRPYTARGFTYAEKIELMKQQNDYDAEFISKLNRKPAQQGATKASGNEAKGSGDSMVDVRIDRKGRRKYSDYPNKRGSKDKDESSSCEPEMKYPKLNQPKSWEETSNQSNDSDHNSNYSDDQPPTLLNNAAAVAYSGLIRTAMLTGVGFPSVPVSEYYGSGEWATAAMETLKSLQSSIDTKNPQGKNEETKHNEETTNNLNRIIKREYVSDDELIQSHDAGFSTCDSTKFRKLSIEADTSNDSDESLPISPKGHKTITESPPDGSLLNKTIDRIRSPSKGISPLLSDSEKQLIMQRSRGINLPSHAPKLKESGSLLAAHLKAKTKMLGSKCSSDPALSSSVDDLPSMSESRVTSMFDSRLTENLPCYKTRETKHELVNTKLQAASGDRLLFINDITKKDFNSDNPVLTWFCSKSKSDESVSNQAITKPMNMPEVFQNCVGTYMKVKLVQKMHVCKVCGFSVDATDSKEVGEKTLQTHVMEHSLKEIYETGSEVSKWH